MGGGGGGAVTSNEAELLQVKALGASLKAGGERLRLRVAKELINSASGLEEKQRIILAAIELPRFYPAARLSSVRATRRPGLGLCRSESHGLLT